MKIDSNLQEALLAGDIVGARAIILCQITPDATLPQYHSIDLCNYAQDELRKKGLSLFDSDDGDTDLSTSQGEWSKDLWDDICIDFEYNFSQEKFNFIINIMQYLRRQGDPDFVVKGGQSAHYSSANSGARSSSQSDRDYSSRAEEELSLLDIAFRKGKKIVQAVTDIIMEDERER